MIKKVLILLLSSVFFLLSFQTLNVQTQKLKTIVIDAGHGGKDPGCHGEYSNEKNITLSVALKLGDYLKANMPGVKIIYTRSDDRFIELHDRANIANKNNADLFVSIHVNAGPEQFEGTETYCMGLHKSEQNLQVAQRENESINMESNKEDNYGGFDPNKPESYIMFSLYQNANLTNSMILAESIEKEFEVYNKRQSRGVKQAGFLVLWKTTMPAVLVETGFLTHNKEEGYLNSEKGQIETAFAIYSAIEDYRSHVEQ